MFRCGAVSIDREGLCLRLIPRIHAALTVQPRLGLHFVIGEDRKCRNAILAIVFELIVSPDEAKVWLKLVEHAAGESKTIDHFLPVCIRMSQPLIGSPLLPHRLRPVVERAKKIRQRRIAEAYFDAPAQIPLSRKSRVMSDSQTKYLSHVSPPGRAVKTLSHLDFCLSID